MTNLLTPFSTRAFDRLNQMMEEMSGPESMMPAWWTQSWPAAAWAPSVDFAETETEYTLKMDLPGFEQKDIEVELRGDVLSISGQREQKYDEKKDGKLIRYERRFGSFNRSFVLEKPLDPKGIEAKFENGVLSVMAKKAPHTEAATKIPVG